MTEAEILNQAEERIEKYRKDDLTIFVADSKGNPIKGARVELSQQKHAFKFGANLYAWRQTDEGWQTEYRRKFAELLNYATLPFYWGSFEREKGKPNYEYTDQVVQWCQEHEILCKGHPLVWYEVPPKWLPDDLGEIRRLSKERVAECAARYQGQIDIWDVVNEAVDLGRLDNPITKAWLDYGQVEFVVESFLTARQTNPHATLIINDYRVEQPYVELIKKLEANGLRIYDVIGIQSHMHRGVWPVSKIWDVCERFQEFGVPLHFTETTIVSGSKTDEGWGQTTPEGELKQAAEVEKFYTVLFSHPAVEAITWWDFADRHAWQGAPAGFLRPDMSLKPLYEKLIALIKGKWWTKEQAITDDRGKVDFRGFYGEYKVGAKAPDGREIEEAIALKFGSVNQFYLSV